MSLLMLVFASRGYAVGGIFMKQSEGVTRLVPTAVFLALFLASATLLAVGMRDADIDASYAFVLGVEAVAAVALGAWVLHEPYSASRLAAIAMIVVGIAWLRRF
jgi:multidrug transporter EmrE-like cation transporter